MNEVLYEGSQSRRSLDRLYAGCLKLAAPELMASMGLGEQTVEYDVQGVGLDTVQKLQPLLKVREAKAER